MECGNINLIMFVSIASIVIGLTVHFYGLRVRSRRRRRVGGLDLKSS